MIEPEGIDTSPSPGLDRAEDFVKGSATTYPTAIGNEVPDTTPTGSFDIVLRVSVRSLSTLASITAAFVIVEERKHKTRTALASAQSNRPGVKI